MATPPRAAQRRARIRFKPDQGAYALLDPIGKRPAGQKFTPSIVALVLDESYTGCALVVILNEPLRPKFIVRVKVGRLAPMLAEVVWIKRLDARARVASLGLQFLE